MAYTLALLPAGRRPELDAILRDDAISRQSHKLRDAATLGGPEGQLYVLIEGDPTVVREAEARLAALGPSVPASEKDRVYRALREEDEAASAGMGFVFGGD